MSCGDVVVILLGPRALDQMAYCCSKQDGGDRCEILGSLVFMSRPVGDVGGVGDARSR